MLISYKSWRRHIYTVSYNVFSYIQEAIYFCNRKSAITWLKKYGKDNVKYHLNLRPVKVVNGYVYFLNELGKLGCSAECKQTCKYATRNN